MTILILGGTAEARELAAALVADGPEVISSLAGRVNSPNLPPGGVRVGEHREVASATELDDAGAPLVGS